MAVIKKLLLVFGAVVICQTSMAQIYKAFLNADGKRIADSTKASYYLLIQKQPGDSVWFGRQYDMTGIILTSGYYKDVRMAVPHGEFNYYRYMPSSNYPHYNPGTGKIDTIKRAALNFIEYTGNYVDGKKSGKWKKYFWNGGMMNIMTYNNDALNGLYEAYDFNANKLIASGQMVNDVKQGEWHTFARNGDVVSTDIYKDGKVINTVRANPAEAPRLGLRVVPNKDTGDIKGKIFNAHPGYDLNSVINQEISGIIKSNLTGVMLLQFWVDQEGKLSDVKFTRHLDNAQDQIIAKALKSAPPWSPAVKDGQPVEQVLYCSISFKDSVAAIKYGDSWVTVLK